MIASFREFCRGFSRGGEKNRTYRVAFAAPSRTEAVAFYVEQVAGYVQLFTSGRLQPTFFYDVTDREGRAQFVANLQVFPYDAVVTIGSPVSKFLLQVFSEDESLRVPVLALAYREMNGGRSVSHVKESSSPNHSRGQYDIISRLPISNKHILFCASESNFQRVTGTRDLISLLRASGARVTLIPIDGKKKYQMLLRDYGVDGNILFLANELLVAEQITTLMELAEQHDLVTVSGTISLMAYGVDCAIGYSQEHVCRRAGEIVACLVQRKPTDLDLFSGVPAEVHINPARLCRHWPVLSEMGRLLDNQGVQIHLYTGTLQEKRQQ